jgi:hypothetical protein
LRRPSAGFRREPVAFSQGVSWWGELYKLTVELNLITPYVLT